jgi:RNA polymerase sigma-70 factor, ECF subfamily
MEFFAFDKMYVDKLREGDPQIEGHFVAYFSELIRLKLRSRLQSREAIEDVRQETFMRVLALLRQEHGLLNPERLGTFVNSVTNHVLLEHYRAAKNREQRSESTLDTQMSEADTDLSSRSMILHILEGLPEVDRMLLLAVFLEGKDRAEACREFHVDESHLKALLQRARERLQHSGRAELSPWLSSG